MASEAGFEKMEGNGEVNSGQLLIDIKAISKALYLPRISPERLISQTSNRSKSAGKSRNEKPNSKRNVLEKEGLYKEKKSSMWNWKKPLKALTHIRNKKFSCTFYLHVHSVEGIPANFDGSSLCVHWRRKENLFRTPPSKVSQGVADFEETLIHKCTVYGQRNGPHNFAKYEERLFLLYVSVIGAPGLDVGKHWVDLTRLLPPTLEELEDEKSSGKWTTTFRLTGRAKGAILNVSFGYSVMGNSSPQLSDVQGIQFFTKQKTDTSSLPVAGSTNASDGHGPPRSTGSNPYTPKPSFRRYSESVTASTPFRDPKLELSRSIRDLHEKFDEGKKFGSTVTNFYPDDVKGSNVKHRVSSASSDELLHSENDDLDFTVVDQGIEISANDILENEVDAETAIDVLAADTNSLPENEENSVNTNSKISSEEILCNYSEDGVTDCSIGGEKSAINEEQYNEKSAMNEEQCKSEEKESAWDSLSLPDPVDLDSSNATAMSLGSEKFTGFRSSFRSSKLVRSFSLDDLAETVADDFLSMLATDGSPYASDSEPGSPRERLLRQFEMETAASGNYLFDSDGDDLENEVGSSSSIVDDTPDCLEDFRLTVCQLAEKNMKRTPSLISRRRAKAVEKLESEDLMKKWGLNEMTFVYSPHRNSGGFGSPIYCSDDESPSLPSLGDGFGPIIQTKDGGFLRSIGSPIFRNAKTQCSLIMQVTTQKVLPAEIGMGITEILQHLASLGVEKFCSQTRKLLPLDNITGKTMQQVAWEAAAVIASNGHNRMTLSKDHTPCDQELTGCSDYASLEELAPLAMDNIEALLVEGLRIESNMPSEEASSSIAPGALEVDDELLSLSLPLDDWFRLDSRIISDEDLRTGNVSELLAAHHAKSIESRIVYGDQGGLMGNSFIIMLRVQLRDPFRSFEPVGGPMLAFIQVNRTYASPEPRTDILVREPNANSNNIESKLSASENSNHEMKNNRNTPDFKITEVHVAGLNSEALNKLLWASTTQQQYGSRWLMSSGMNKPFKKNKDLNSSRQMVRYTPPNKTGTKLEDKLWSVSYGVPETATNLNHILPSNSFIRNPDVIFSKR